MLPAEKAELHGVIALLDQAIAPLSNASKVLTPLYTKEKDLLNGRVDIEESNPERFDNLAALGKYITMVNTVVEGLNELKILLEKY